MSPLSISHHNCEDVLRPGFIVQSVCGVNHPSARVDSEQPHAGRIHAAVDGEAQARAVVHVRGSQAQELRVHWRVL